VGLILLFIIFEVFRIRNGYFGNLKESFPEIITFMLLTLANSGIIIAFFLIWIQTPIETATLSIQSCFFGLEIIVAYITKIEIDYCQTDRYTLANQKSASNLLLEDP